MANLKDIRKRIVTVKNTRQITRAMKMVAAAKLRRAQDAILNARPYAYQIYSILLSLAQDENVVHPLLKTREEKRCKLIVLAGDRGLCGAFNSSIFKRAEIFLAEKKSAGIDVKIECVGKKSQEYFSKRHEVAHYYEGLISKPEYKATQEIAEKLLDHYQDEQFDATYLIYNEFKSAIQQTVAVEKLIPVSTEVPEGVVGIRSKSEVGRPVDYKYEPSKQELLNEVLPRHFQVQLFRAVLESVAAEHGARMSAMDSATNNANEMVDNLTLDYNKARQAAITTELSEIVGGVESMK